MDFKIEREFLMKADEAGRGLMRERLLEKHRSIEAVTVARSILSRPIEAYYIGSGKRYACVFAAHHALESVTSNVAYLLIDYLASGAREGRINNVDCKLLLSKYRFVIVPCVNPDGIELRFHGASDTPLRERQMRMSSGDFSTWQANARGVDLNHNYDAGFSEYKALESELGITPGPTLYSGEYPESEPESKGVANLVRTLLPVALVSLHTQGEQIYCKPEGRRVRRYAGRISALTGYTVSVPDGTAAYGGLADYSGSLGIPSFTLELGRGENPLPESVIPDLFRRVKDAIFLLPTFL